MSGNFGEHRTVRARPPRMGRVDRLAVRGLDGAAAAG